MRNCIQFILLLLAILDLGFAADLAVVKEKGSVFFERAYLSFIASANSKYVEYETRRGKDKQVANSINIQNPSAVVVFGQLRPELSGIIKKSIPILHVHYLQIDDHSPGKYNPERPIVDLPVELSPSQILQMLSQVMPEKKRIGVAFNPKLSKKMVAEYREAISATDFSFVFLKIDQPEDMSGLIASFKDKIDVFLLIRDATVLKAGMAAIKPFLNAHGLPIVSAAKWLELGSLISMNLDAVSVGRRAWTVSQQVTRGQRVLMQEYPLSDIQLFFSLRAAEETGMTGDAVMALQKRVVASGYKLTVEN